MIYEIHHDKQITLIKAKDLDEAEEIANKKHPSWTDIREKRDVPK